MQMQVFDGHIEGIVLTALLRQGALSTKELIERVGQARSGTTKQGVYRVLRALVKQEKIIIYKSLVSINELWREQVSRTLGGPVVGVRFANLEHLSEGERLDFRANTLVHADQVWSQLFLGVEPAIPAKHPLYVYNPHNWFIILRPETERLHAERLLTRRPVFLSIGGTTALDRETGKLAHADGYECALSPRIKNASYIAVIGPYVTETKISKRSAQQISAIFKTTENLEEARERLATVAASRISVRISIEKNAHKAQQWKKRLSHEFFIPKRNRDF